QPQVVPTCLPYTTLFRSRCGRLTSRYLQDARNAEGFRVFLATSTIPRSGARLFGVYRSRRHSKDSERNPETSEAMIYITMIQLRSEEHTSELQSRENLVC